MIEHILRGGGGVGGGGEGAGARLDFLAIERMLATHLKKSKI